MLKRQEESSLSSSSRRQAAAATPPPSETHHAKAIGCMSGIFQLFSKYQNPNKRLTFGRKQEKLKPPSPTKPRKSRKDHKPEKQTFEDTFAVKVQRSPTLPPEIRRSNSAAIAPENPRTSPSSSLVARLMGLDLEGLAAAEKKTPPPPAAEEDRVTEKRRRLLQALEKCNEDLEALKRIIKAVQATDVRTQPPAEETNIPEGVAEELSRSRQIISTAGAARAPQQRKPIAAKKPGEDDESITKPLNKSIIINSESSLSRRRQAAAAAVTPPWCSQAMVKSVEEVCGDIDWGEKREIGRMGLMLQDYLCRELIEELVRELTKSCSIDHSLPFDACKRRLCF